MMDDFERRYPMPGSPLEAKVYDLDKQDAAMDSRDPDALNKFYAAAPTLRARVHAIKAWKDDPYNDPTGLSIVIETDTEDVELLLPVDLILRELSRVGDIAFVEEADAEDNDLAVSPDGSYCIACGGPCYGNDEDDPFGDLPYVVYGWPY